tara:strand:- start:42340 stop:43485 length:1146 start_codon:yes stop_codon:yes gene_type:complete
VEEIKTYLVLTPFFPSSSDHKGVYIYDQLNQIRCKKNYKINIVKFVSIFSNEKNYTFRNFDVFIFKLIDIPFFIFPGLFKSLNNFRFNNFLKKNNIFNIGVIHAHVTYPSAYIANSIKSCVKVKKIIQHHGLDVIQLNNCKFKFFRYLQRRFLKHNSILELNKFDYNIGVSKLVLEKLNKFSNYQPKLEYVFYNGVDTTKFYELEVEENKQYTIGCVANFWELKDHICLIKAVEYLYNKNVHLYLRFIGSGPTFSACYNYVVKNNLTNIISFESEMPHENLNLFYNEIDLFVLPSYYEALGCVYLESWATNTPFVAIKGQGISELVKDRDKIFSLANPKDVNSLVECISKNMNSNRHFIFDNKYRIDNLVEKFYNNVIISD